jgi:alanine racemase
MEIMERSIGPAAADPELPGQEERTGTRRSVVPSPDLDNMRVEVNLGAVVANARSVQAIVGPSTGVLAVLKADAYGHGLVQVARALERDGTIAGFVVTTLRDGQALRRDGVDLPIVAMVCDYASDHDAVLDARLTPVLASTSDLEAFAAEARGRGTSAAAHVEIDTGMSRIGLHEDEIESFLAAAARRPEIVVSGLCTHLASADDSSPAAAHRQLDAFERARARFRDAGHRPTTIHAANTAATFRLPRAHFSHVRTGIAIFGGDEPSGARLRPAMRVVTRVARLRSVDAGATVSYGEKWRASRPSRIATLPVGFAHGYPRRLFGRAEVLIRGRRCPVVGSICMEMTMVDVTDVPGVGVEDEAVLLGQDGAEEVRATELAAAIDGIVEEIFCGLPRSARRAYVGAALRRVPNDSSRDLLDERASERHAS